MKWPSGQIKRGRKEKGVLHSERQSRSVGWCKWRLGMSTVPSTPNLTVIVGSFINLNILRVTGDRKRQNQLNSITESAVASKLTIAYRQPWHHIPS